MRLTTMTDRVFDEMMRLIKRQPYEDVTLFLQSLREIEIPDPVKSPTPNEVHVEAEKLPAKPAKEPAAKPNAKPAMKAPAKAVKPETKKPDLSKPPKKAKR